MSDKQSNEELTNVKDQSLTSAPEDQTNNMGSQDFLSQNSNEGTTDSSDHKSASVSEDQTNNMSSPDFLNLSNSLRSLGKVEDTNKKLPPAMKRMLQVQSRNTLLEIHKELKEFIKLIEDIQKEAPDEFEVVTVKPLQTEISWSASSTSSNSSSELKELKNIDSRPTNAPIRDAFQIVRNLLSKIATLIDKTACTTAITDDAIVDVHSPQFSIYYAQYVFQIACYVSKMIGEHLNKFSCILDETSRNETELPKTDFQSVSSYPKSFLHRKDHSFCTKNSNANDIPDFKNEMISKDVPGETTIYSKNEAHMSENEIQKRIYDAIQLLQLLSRRMLSPKEEESKFKDAIRKKNLKENVNDENTFETNKEENNFNDNKFLTLLKDELKKNLYEYSNNLPENSCYSNIIAIVNLIEESFRKARGVKVTENKADNFQKSSISPTKQDEEKHLVDVIEAFVNEAYTFTLLTLSTENEITPAGGMATKNLWKAQTEPEPITIEEKVVLLSKPMSSSEILDRTGIEEIRECSSCPQLVQFKLSDFLKTKSKTLFSVKDSEDIESRSTCDEQCLKGQILHENHDLLPNGKMEVRQVDDHGQVVISLEEDKMDVSKELINCKAIMDLRDGGSRKDMRPEKSSNKVINTLLSKLSSPGSGSLRKVEEQLMTTSSYSNLIPTVKIGGETHDKAFAICEIVEKMHNLGERLKKAGYNTGPPLILKLRLENIYEEAFKTLTVISGIPLSYYKKILIYVYKKSDESEGEDLTDEIFPILGENLLRHQEDGPFVYPTDHSLYVYPNPASTSLSEQFRFTGILLAVALIQNEFLGVKLPVCFYKCLLDRSLELHDLEEIDPVLHQKLKWLNENNISGRKPMFHFTIKERVGKKMIVSELIENGRQLNVSENNKMLFIEKCLKRNIVERCIMQYKEIINGFNSVLETRFLDEFKVVEIQKMIEKCPCFSGCEIQEDDDSELTIKSSF
ncbi:hypothetical protein JTE90_009928 [Oedothorax gibbosus]|uniref:HECT-type E3 ubiquitin transferase n=1 Tax=Oedothorax gibbosus TaxID=931172 RepID=A0AAV6UU89_9ARAC|nr:hypothetical protein JTE90_009928 [Oedothorax gibbosus]